MSPLNITQPLGIWSIMATMRQKIKSDYETVFETMIVLTCFNFLWISWEGADLLQACVPQSSLLVYNPHCLVQDIATNPIRLAYWYEPSWFYHKSTNINYEILKPWWNPPWNHQKKTGGSTTPREVVVQAADLGDLRLPTSRIQNEVSAGWLPYLIGGESMVNLWWIHG